MDEHPKRQNKAEAGERREVLFIVGYLFSLAVVTLLGMRILGLVAVLGSIAASGAETADERAVVAAAQKLFDAMAAHDSEMARAGVLGEGRTLAVRDNGAVSGGTLEQFAARLSTMTEPIVERMWNPKVRIEGRLAQVWGEYDFWRAGKFSHCGVDAFDLVKTDQGWKISAISYTVHTTGCAPSPLGPLAGAEK